MKTKVWPIGTSILNWNTFITEVTSLTGHNPSRTLDNSKITFSDHAKVTILLTEFMKGGVTKPLDDLSYANVVLDHLFFSFLIHAPLSVVIDFNTYSSLEIISSRTIHKGYRLLYISGNLSKWRQSILSIISSSNNKELKYIAKTCLNSFYKAGLKQVFSRSRLENNTLLLEYKDV